MAERKKEESFHAGPFPFPATLSLSSFLSSPFKCPGFSSACSLARSLAYSLARSFVRSCIRGANRIRNKTNPISRNARDQREDPTYTLKLDLGLSTSRYVFSFSLPPRIARALALSSRLSLNVPRCFSLRLWCNLSFPRDIRRPTRSGETRVKGTRKAGMTKPALCCEKGASTIADHSAGRGQLERSGKERGKEKG